MNREKKLSIALLKEKLETLTGKTVVFEKTEKEKKVEQLIEALEKVSGKKVVFSEAPVVPGQAPVAAAPAPVAQTPATPAPGTQPAPTADPGKSAAAKAVAAMSADPIIAQMIPAMGQLAANPTVKKLAVESTMNEEVITLTMLMLGLGAIGALAAIGTAWQNSQQNAAMKAKLLAAIQKDFAKAGVQSTPEQIDAELAKRFAAAKSAEANKKFGHSATNR